MKKYKIYIVMVILLIGISSFAFPKAKYKGTDFISQLEMPHLIKDWIGEDVTEQLNIDFESSVFNFMNDAVAYHYVDKVGNKVLFAIFDAGDFHHPKSCFTGAGYKIQELSDTEFNISGRNLKTHTLFTEKDEENFLTFYWIVIDKNIAHQWIEQKLKQLYFSLLNKKRVGLMVRIDIPTKKENINNSMIIAKDFINDMSEALHQEKSDYIFGQL